MSDELGYCCLGNEMCELDPVVLTDEEAEECQQVIRRFTQTEDGEWVIRKDIADWFQRGLVSHCLMGRAERFLSEAGGNQVHIVFHTPYYSPDLNLDEDLVEKACIAAAKACAIYPLPTYFYDLGCILYQSGKMDEARTAFQQFLGALQGGKLAPTMQFWLDQRDVKSAAQLARELIG